MYIDRVWRMQRNETGILEVRQGMDWEAYRPHVYLLLVSKRTNMTCAEPSQDNSTH